MFLHIYQADRKQIQLEVSQNNALLKTIIQTCVGLFFYKDFPYGQAYFTNTEKYSILKSPHIFDNTWQYITMFFENM